MAIQREGAFKNIQAQAPSTEHLNIGEGVDLEQHPFSRFYMLRSAKLLSRCAAAGHFGFWPASSLSRYLIFLL